MKAILFDFGGTLDADGLTWPDRFFDLYKEAGVESPRAAFDRAFYAADDALARRHRLAGLNLEQTLILQVQDALGALAPERAALAAGLTRAFLAQSRGVLTRNKASLERLSRRFRLGVVSNFYGNLESVLAGEGLGGLFSAVADSGVLGFTKPDRRIFDHALSALGCAPEEALMVGDSVPRDMKGAEALGMPHALVGGQTPCCPSALRLKSVSELEAALAAGVRR